MIFSFQVGVTEPRLVTKAEISLMQTNRVAFKSTKFVTIALTMKISRNYISFKSVKVDKMGVGGEKENILGKSCIKYDLENLGYEKSSKKKK